MKKIINSLILCVALSFGFVSCSDFLDSKSPSELTPGVVYGSLSYSEQALNKVYSGLTLDHTYGCRFPLNFSTNSDIELVDALGADKITEPNERGLCNYNPVSSWSRIDDNWKASFEIIEDANSVIEGLEGSAMLAEGHKDRKQALAFLGEAMTIRAMVYFDVVKNYGDVPMKFESTKSDGSNIYLQKTNRDEIIDRLLLDLEQAAQNLPWVGTMGYTSEKITSGFARGLYARIALARAGWAIRESSIDGYETATNGDGTYPTQRPGATERKELYEKALNQLDTLLIKAIHGLNPSYENLWSNTNKLILDPSHENLYEVAHGLGFSGELGYTAGIRINGASSFYGPKGNSSGKLKVTAPFFWSFDKDDQRRDITCATYELKDDAGVVKENMQKNAPFSIYLAKWDIRKMNASWLSTVRASADKVGYGVNWIVMRYSDVLLMYAEIANELHGPTGAGAAGVTAKDALIQVRTRSFEASKHAGIISSINALGSKDDLFSAIVDERAWELAGEAVRKYDLIRWNLLIDKTEQLKSDYKDIVAVKAPQYLFYKLNADFSIDMSSILWYENLFADEAAGIAAGYSSVAGWGTRIDGKGVSSNATNLEQVEHISAGLTSTVKNRHLIPLGTKTLADSNGTLENSYGF